MHIYFIKHYEVVQQLLTFNINMNMVFEALDYSKLRHALNDIKSYIISLMCQSMLLNL